VQYGTDGKIASDRRFDANNQEIAAPQTAGLVISIQEVFSGTQAAALGLQRGDVVWAYNDWRFSTYLNEPNTKVAYTDLLIQLSTPGDQKRRLEILRRGQLRTFDVTPGLLGVLLIEAKEVLPRELLAQPPSAASIGAERQR
jgi:S1-C subfamily serine protease